MLTCQLCNGDTPNYQREVEQRAEITALQAQLAERDKDIAELHNALHERDQTSLEQQARIKELGKYIEYDLKFAVIGSIYENGVRTEHRDNLSALEAALKAERIKTLEDAAEILYGAYNGGVVHSVRSILRMANKLKDK